METFTKVIPLLAFIAMLAVAIYKPAEAKTVDCSRSNFEVRVYSVRKSDVEIETKCFRTQQEADEYALAINSKPIIDVLGKKIARTAVKDYYNF